MKTTKAHLIRWVLIIAMGTFIFSSVITFQAWSADDAIKESLRGMDLPGDVEVISMIEAGKMKAVLFWDEEYQMYHHSWMRHHLGMFWTPKGGGFGYTIEEDEWKIRFGEGMTNESNNRSYHYVIGQVNDPKVKTIELLWNDGAKETMEPIRGHLIHFARVGKAGEFSVLSKGLNAYDADGVLLYELDHNNNSVLVK